MRLQAVGSPPHWSCCQPGIMQCGSGSPRWLLLHTLGASCGTIPLQQRCTTEHCGCAHMTQAP